MRGNELVWPCRQRCFIHRSTLMWSPLPCSDTVEIAGPAITNIQWKRRVRRWVWGGVMVKLFTAICTAANASSKTPLLLLLPCSLLLQLGARSNMQPSLEFTASRGYSRLGFPGSPNQGIPEALTNIGLSRAESSQFKCFKAFGDMLFHSLDSKSIPAKWGRQCSLLRGWGRQGSAKHFFLIEFWEVIRELYKHFVVNLFLCQSIKLFSFPFPKDAVDLLRNQEKRPPGPGSWTAWTISRTASSHCRLLQFLGGARVIVTDRQERRKMSQITDLWILQKPFANNPLSRTETVPSR